MKRTTQSLTSGSKYLDFPYRIQNAYEKSNSKEHTSGNLNRQIPLLRDDSKRINMLCEIEKDIYAEKIAKSLGASHIERALKCALLAYTMDRQKGDASDLLTAPLFAKPGPPKAQQPEPRDPGA